jgi:hypothetical protein
MQSMGGLSATGEGWVGAKGGSRAGLFISAGLAEAGGAGCGWGGAVCLGWVAGLATKRGGASEDGWLPAKRQLAPCPPARGASVPAKRAASPRARASGACGACAGAGAARRVRGWRWRGGAVGGWVERRRAAPEPRRAAPQLWAARGDMAATKGTHAPAPRWVGGWSGAGGAGHCGARRRARRQPCRVRALRRLGRGAGGWVAGCRLRRARRRPRRARGAARCRVG